MKYECSECTARSWLTVRPAATRACPATWPPKTRCRETLGLRPRKMFSSIGSRSSSRTSPSTTDCPAPSVDSAPGTVRGSAVTLQNVSDVVDADGVRRPGRRRRRTGDHDDEVTAPAYPALDEGRVDLADHVVRRLHHPHEMRLDAPQQRQLAQHVLVRREREQPLARMQARQAAHRVASLGERDERGGAQGV